ncbi:aldehyde reductase II [Metarhizium robertsii ARSEF 23]|uniref:Aldehyde reductase II n=1 Tax=Metarhizium robertsii (strain ARSEF 23 / ATCC MYA-3075) TaxID=655844 RepID=E9F3J2_METRA|nr:aldehyde reductase II [Metarhizium robertsii ARSEF 23]EFY97729.1 aldehyde reductase II [Metarhizium robertsii ARSEF 23]
MSQTTAIPKGSLILVTGANGYIASNIVDLLLELGYRVRGTVREHKPWLTELFEKRHAKGLFETVVTANMEEPGAFDEAMQDVAGVIHVASIVSMNPDPSAVIPNVVRGTENILTSASKHPAIKRFVLTSSSTAALIPKPNEKCTVTEGMYFAVAIASQEPVDPNLQLDTWNDDAVKAAWSESTPAAQKPYVVYAASKTEGERAAWNWMRENKPHFVMNTVLPNVNDTARLHVIGLLDPAVRDERLFAFAGPHNWTDVIQVFRRLCPQSKLPPAPENEGRDLSDVKPAKRAEQLLRDFFGLPGWTSLQDSLADGIDGFDESDAPGP